MNRDRGILKWQPATMLLPEFRGMLQEVDRDEDRTDKPEIDDQQLIEFDEKIHYAIAENHPVILTKWEDGLKSGVYGFIHYIDEVNKELRLKLADEDDEDSGIVACVAINSLIEVKVID